MTREKTPVAYIYDRHATTNTVILDMRLKACAKYVTAKGWGFGGWWLDKGDYALTDGHRPAFDTLLRTMQTGTAHPRVLLVYDWHRLSRNQQACGLMTRRALLLGGWVETTSGDKRTLDGRYEHAGRLTAGPATA